MDLHQIRKGGAFVLSNKDASRSLLGGVVVLGIGNLLVKVIGLFFKIPLSRLLGDEGMGYFNTGYTVYSWLFIVGCTGFPVAVSMLVSEATEQGDDEPGAARRILLSALTVLLVIGSVGFTFLSVFAGQVSKWIGNPGSAASIRSIAPAVLFCSLSGGIRGYFQGKKRMAPTAFSQFVEAALKLILGILFARRAIISGAAADVAAAAGIRGVTAGTVASTFLLLLELVYDFENDPIKYKGRKREKKKREQGRLLRIAAPVTLSATVASLAGMIDLAFMMRRLVASGLTLPEATAVFGNYTTLAVPFFNLPAILITPIATGIVPFVSGDLARGDKIAANERCRTAIRFAVFLSIPAALGLGLFGGRILSLFFVRSSSALAAPALAVLSPGIVFLSLVTVSSAILQARGRAGITVFSMLLGAVVKMIAGYYLIGLPSVGVKGAAIGTVLCYGVAAAVNMIVLLKEFGLQNSLVDLVRPVLPAGLSFSLAYLLLSFMPDRTNVFSTVFLLTITAALYLPLSVLSGSFRVEDADAVPFLRRFFAKGVYRKKKE